MRGLFVHSHIFNEKDGYFYSEGKLTYDMWKNRYLPYLDNLTVAGRKKKVSNVDNLNISSGPKVTHISLPNLSSINERVLNKKKVYNTLKSVIIENEIDIVIIRLPSIHGLIANKVAKSLNIKVVTEMVGDPFNALWFHGNPLAKIYAPISFLKYKIVLRNLDNIIFVTKYYLQSRYKKNYKDYHVTNISNVNLPANNNVDVNNKLLKQDLREKDSINIALIGSYSSKYKGIKTGIKAAQILINKGYNVHLYILGSGKKDYYLNFINELKIEGNIHFIPPIKGGERVLKWLDNFDFYIQPSLTEGLPRSLIEAMSRGIPSIATNVGGIPELLDNQMQIKINDHRRMAEIILELIVNKEEYNIQVLKNIKKAQSYNDLKLQIKRDKFWGKMLEGDYL